MQVTGYHVMEWWLLVSYLQLIMMVYIYNADDNLMMFDGSAGEYYGIYNDDDKLIDDG